MIALTWTSGPSIVIYVAGAITAVLGAIVLLTDTGRRLLGWVRPSEPLIAFGHPSETQRPWAFFVGGGADLDLQDRAYEQARLKSLDVNYQVENKGTTNDDAVRELSTGIRRTDGEEEHMFDDCFVQILGPGNRVELYDEHVPPEMHDGMDQENRAEQFVYWARFRDSRRRRWEATYDARNRSLSYKRLR